MQEPTRLFDFIHFQLQHHPLTEAFGYRREGQWRFFSTEEVLELANQVSRGLIQLGVQKGDKIGVVAYQNRPEWVILDIGIQQIGAVNVPVYPTISAREYEYIFNDAEIVYCFVGEGDLYDKVETARRNTPSLRTIYTFDRQPGRPYWQEIFSEEGQAEVAARMDEAQPDELATLIYTSGTTGNPKGVMLSHRNIVSNAIVVRRRFPLKAGETVLSFLPLCHIFERTALYVFTYTGNRVAFAGTDNLGGEEGDLRSVRPHFFTTVPRLLEKVYEKLYHTGLGLSWPKRWLFFWALDLTRDFEYDKTYSGWAAVKRRLADRLIYARWREALGGRIKGILTGAAPCPVNIAQVFSAAGIPIREGYGLTETSPGLCVGRYEPNGARLGMIGPPLDGVSIRIDTEAGEFSDPEEGEILAHGPNVMMGYYQQPDATAAVFVEWEGKRWFRTGDIGKLVPGPTGEPFLKVTDRKKELLKTSGGKYVAPAPIENKLKEEFLIEQVMVVGDGRKFVAALIVPVEEALQDWCAANNLPWTNMAEMVEKPEVVTKYQEIVDRINPCFSQIEQIKKFTLIPDQWEANKQDGTEAELTPTLKLKRRVIQEKYRREIEALY